MKESPRFPLALLVVVASLLSCDPGAPETDDLFTSWEFVALTPGATTLQNRVIALIDSAETAAWLAAEDFSSVAIAEALVRAQARGVDVRVVGDIDRRDQAGFDEINTGLQPVDGEIPVRFGDGPLFYNPQLIDTVFREGDHNRMTHNFVVVDDLRVVSVTGGFGPTDVHQVGFEARSHFLGRDFADEFNQLFGGTFATTLSAFNGPLKSITDNRSWYDSDNGRLEVYFGPQERLVKQIIDRVYEARASVTVVTEELTSLPLANALRYKAEAGFDVTVVISAEGQDVPSSRYERLEDAFADLDNARIGIAGAVMLNAVIIDDQASPIDGQRYRSWAMFLSEPLLAATAVIEGTTLVSRPADAFCDSNMFVMRRGLQQPDFYFSDGTASVNRIVEEAFQ